MRRLVGWMLVLLVLGGCRTYGAYDNEEQTLEEIAEANAVFADELERARADLATLDAAASGDARLAEPAVVFGATLALHELALAAHLLAAEEVDDDDYRELHRLYGAIISDQQIIRDQYAYALAGLDTSVAATPAEDPGMQARYYVVPPYYERIRQANERLSVTERLRRAGQAPGYVAPSGGLVPGPTPPADTTATR